MRPDWDANPRPARLRILSVDDDSDWARVLRRVMHAAEIEVELDADPHHALDRLAAGDDFDAVLLDMTMPEMSGLELLRRIRELPAAPAVVMLTGDDRATTAAACFRAGAFHYLTKPLRAPELVEAVEAASHQTALARTGRRATGSPTLLAGRSPEMARVQAAIERLAVTEVNVLIQGESGTGKELAARALHELGPRKAAPFVAVNCGAIPDTLIDSELFGYNRGAFTGAAETRPGLFAQADGGTIFLDEIGDMPLGVQARLLRVLQEGEVRPLGGQGTTPIDVRVIAATHVDLQRAVAEGKFRQDLFFRFNVVALRLPPLRERIDDIPVLAAQLLQKHAPGNTVTLSPAALEALMAHDWPGNVRELENALLHAIALGGRDYLDVDALPPQVRRSSQVRREPDAGEPDELPLPDAKRIAVAQFERGYLERVLVRARGNVSEAARQAGLDRSNFRRLLQRHGIDVLHFKG